MKDYKEFILKILRIKPVAAWSIGAFLLGTSVAINSVGGEDINWFYLFLTLIGAILIQGIIAHSMNDLIDEEVDKKTDIKGTRRTKVLIDGIAKRSDLKIITYLSIIASFLIAIYLYIALGYFILIFYTIGIYAAVGYSVSPLKLGWRPFSEWTIVFPVLVSSVVAFSFVATGYLLLLALKAGIVFALLNIIWFLVSRVMDYEPDKKAGKKTSAVLLGCSNMSNYFSVIFFLLFFYILYYLVFIDRLWCFSVSALFTWLMFNTVMNLYSGIINNPTSVSILRQNGILISISHSVVLSFFLLI